MRSQHDVKSTLITRHGKDSQGLRESLRAPSTTLRARSLTRQSYEARKVLFVEHFLKGIRTREKIIYTLLTIEAFTIEYGNMTAF